MAPCQTMTLQDYVIHLRRVCPTLPAPKTLIRKLRSPETGIAGHKITFPIPCADGSRDGDARLCPIFQELALWNELLSFVNVELVEAVSGRLEVVRLRKMAPLGNKRRVVQLALVCLHWLLTQHRCIDSFEPDPRILQDYPRLFCDALKLGKTLKHVRLGDAKYFLGMGAEPFAAICKTRHLEELTCDGLIIPGDRKTLTTHMAACIKKSTCLKTLRLTRIWMGLDGGPIVAALRGNSTITKLTVDARLVDPGSFSAFASFLESNAVLIELTLIGKIREAAARLHPVFHALEHNTTLCKLGLQNYNFDMIASTMLSIMLSVNTSLQEVSFDSCCWENCTDWGDKNYNLQMQHAALKAKWGALWRAEVFVHAIENSASLQRLEFDSNHFLDMELLVLLEAVQQKASFCELRFGRVSSLSAAQFAVFVHHTGNASKVTVAHLYSSSKLFAECLNEPTTLPPTAVNSFYDLNSKNLVVVCLALTIHDSITSLYLFFDDAFDTLDESSADFLAAYLASAKALKDLKMCFSVADEALDIILDGMSQNKSLQKLCMKDFLLDHANVTALCGWLAGNHTLYHFECCCFYLGHAKAMLLSELQDLLHKNYTLTFARVEKRSQNNEEWLGVKQMVSRNSSLVVRAADFVLGSRLKFCASAFELVSWHPLVQERVQEIASLSASEARRKVHDAEVRLRAGFWELSGVVDEELRCYNSEDSKLQIDELDYDAWLEVRKFLSVADICDG